MPRRLKKAVKVLVILSLVIIVFRGWIFQKSISYTQIGTRKEIKLQDEKLIAQLGLAIYKDSLSMDEIIEIARTKTNENVAFTTEKSSKNPNEVLKTGSANCIGYAALFNSILNYFIKKQQLEHKFKANHVFGKVYFLGIDLHQFFDTPFLKDHDYNEIVNLKTSKKYYIDLTVSDYLRIHEISSK